jgi:hypothetical protein
MSKKITYLIEEEIDKSYKKKWKFAQTRAYDSGVRWVEMEFYIKGLEKAKRLVNKALKNEQTKEEE